MTAAKDGVQGRRRLRIFAAAIALVLLCAVCVGGVSGAETYSHTYYVPANGTLAEVVGNAVNESLIIITEDYVIEDQVVFDAVKEQVGSGFFGRPIYAYTPRFITIMNAPGIDVVVSGNLGELTSSDNNIVDTRTLFKVNAGTLRIKPSESGGSLTFTTDFQGRAFDVNYDDGSYLSNDGDGQDATLEMWDGVHIYQCGFSNEDLAQSNNGGAVYVRDGGHFIMHGGLLSENKAGGGGAVYVASGGYFELNDGLITNNNALYTGRSHSKWGGGVWAANANIVKWNGGEIKGNTAMAQSPAGEDYNEIYPYIAPPVTKEISPIYVVAGSTTYDDYWSVKEAYDAMISKGIKTFTIHIRRDFTQGYIETWVNNAYVTAIDEVTVGSGISVTLKPDTASITLNIIDQMFHISGGSFNISGNDGAVLTVSGKNEGNSVEMGGFILVDGGSFILQDGVAISATKAKNGGAIYVNSGTCTLGGGSITGCSASVHGAAVYVNDGTLIVNNSFTLPATNDIYLADNQVITVASGYSGSIGKITLSNYDDGRNVVNVTAYSSISASKFILNDEAHEEVEKTLVLTTEGSKKFLEIQSQIQFTITIPEDLELSTTTYDGIMTVSAKNVKIPQNAWISVTVQSQYDFNLTHARDSSILLPYALTLGSSTTALENNAEIARFTMANSPGSVNMQAKVTVEPQYSGSYADYLTFTIQYGTA